MAWTNTDPDTTPSAWSSTVQTTTTITGTAIDPDRFVHITWGSAGAEVSSAIDITATARDYDGNVLTSDTVVVKVVVSASANSLAPQGTVTLTAATIATGTIMDGDGTGTMIIETTTAGQFAVKVNENGVTGGPSVYLHVMEGPGSQVHVRAGGAPQLITFSA